MQEKKIYFGWWIVFTCFLLMALVYATSTTLIGQLIPSIVANYTGGNVTAAMSFVTATMFAAMIGSPIAGGMIAKFGTRNLVVAMLLICTASNVGMYFADSIGLLIVLSAVRGFTLAFLGIVPISVLVNSWFGVKAKGRAMAFATIGSGIGGIALAPVLGIIIASNDGADWKNSFIMFAALSLICIPFVLATFVPSPEAKGLKRLGDPTEAEKQQSTGAPVLTGITGKEALGAGMFWAVLIGFLFVGGICQTWVNNAPGFYGALSIDAVQIGFLVAVTALAMTVGKILLGIFCDKFGAKLGFLVSSAFLILCYVLAIFAGFSGLSQMGIVCAAAIGLGMASLNITLPLIVNDICGNKQYSVVMGYAQMVTSVGAAFLPMATAVFYDMAKNSGDPAPYTMTFGITAVLGVISIVCVFAAYALRKKHKTATAL